MPRNWNPSKGDDLDKIRTRLAEAMDWFHLAGDNPASGFPRSKEFGPPDDLEWPTFDWPNAEQIESACNGRSKVLLSKRADALSRNNNSFGEGRILGYRLRWSLADGASEAVTQGFFDVYDVPPWDLWIGCIVDTSDNDQEYLVSWIPQTLVALAQLGLEVDPLESLLWLEAIEAELSR